MKAQKNKKSTRITHDMRKGVLDLVRLHGVNAVTQSWYILRDHGKDVEDEIIKRKVKGSAVSFLSAADLIRNHSDILDHLNVQARINTNQHKTKKTL